MSTLLVGCGYWGQNWAKTLLRLGELGAICETHPETAEKIKALYPETEIYTQLDAALTHPGIEAVVIATPVPTHHEMARDCLLAKKGVLVEKPLTLSSNDAHDLLNIADALKKPLAVGHLLMYHPALLTLQRMIQAGELGDILSVQCTRVNLGKIRNEENVWWSLAPHDVSILSMLLQEPFEVETVSKQTLLNRYDIPDTVYSTFRTPSGKQGSIHVSWYSPSKRHETVVIGTKKIAIFEDTLPPDKKLQIIDYNLERSGQWVHQIAKGESQYISYTMPDELLALEAKAFLDHVQHGTPIQNHGQNALQVVEILEAVQARLDNPALALCPV